MVRAKNDGPDLPPLTPDLRHTPAEAIHELFGAVFLQALNEGDAEWMESPDYLLVAEFAGIDAVIAERVRAKFRRGEIKPGALAGLAPATPWERSQRQVTGAATQPTEPNRVRPVQLVRAIAASMPGARPSEVIRACVAAGINPATANTQVSKFRREQQALATPSGTPA